VVSFCSSNWLWIVPRNHDPFLNDSEDRHVFATGSPNFHWTGSSSRLPALRYKLKLPIRVIRFACHDAVIIDAILTRYRNNSLSERWRALIVSYDCSYDIRASLLFRNSDDCQKGRKHQWHGMPEKNSSDDAQYGTEYEPFMHVRGKPSCGPKYGDLLFDRKRCHRVCLTSKARGRRSPKGGAPRQVLLTGGPLDRSV